MILNAATALNRWRRIYTVAFVGKSPRKRQVLALGSALAHLDAFTALAEVAVHHNYVRPTLDDGNVIDIKEAATPW